jgi:hypothetical protein
VEVVEAEMRSLLAEANAQRAAAAAKLQQLGALVAEMAGPVLSL